jgi:hypothetical protein
VPKATTIRFVATLVVVTGAVALSAAVALVAVTRAPGNGGLGPLAWLLPLATVVVACGIALMLSAGAGGRPVDDRAGSRLRDCPACGREVGGEWRLCPWCGDRLATGGRGRAT